MSDDGVQQQEAQKLPHTRSLLIYRPHLPRSLSISLLTRHLVQSAVDDSIGLQHSGAASGEHFLIDIEEEL